MQSTPVQAGEPIACARDRAPRFSMLSRHFSHTHPQAPASLLSPPFLRGASRADVRSGPGRHATERRAPLRSSSFLPPAPIVVVVSPIAFPPARAATLRFSVPSRLSDGPWRRPEAPGDPSLFPPEEPIGVWGGGRGLEARERPPPPGRWGGEGAEQGRASLRRSGPGTPLSPSAFSRLPFFAAPPGNGRTRESFRQPPP